MLRPKAEISGFDMQLSKAYRGAASVEDALPQQCWPNSQQADAFQLPKRDIVSRKWHNAANFLPKPPVQCDCCDAQGKGGCLSAASGVAHTFQQFA